MNFITKRLLAWEVEYGQIRISGEDNDLARQLFTDFFGKRFTLKTFLGEFPKVRFNETSSDTAVRLSCSRFFKQLNVGDVIYLHVNNKGEVEILNTEPSINQLVFDRITGEFIIADKYQPFPPDATTINSIAQDGFAGGDFSVGFFGDHTWGRTFSIESYLSKKDPGGAVTLFYGTTRNKLPGNHVNTYYGDKFDKLQQGVCTVNIPPGHKIGEIERPKNILLWQQNENEDKHFTLTNIIELNGDSLYGLLNASIDNASSKSAFIFIHGFNTTFHEAALRTAQITHDIPFAGVSGFFSWPSTGHTLDYIRDIERADVSIPLFIKFVENLIQNTAIEELHFIAHSMGNRILTRALNRLVSKESFKNKVKTIKQIILAAPDIDKDVFHNDILPELKSVGTRRTLYASDKDSALKKSKMLRIGLPRIGEAGSNLYIEEGLDTIDASNVMSEGNNHSYIFETKELLTDLFLIFSHDLEPVQRGLREVNAAHLRYWLFRE